MSRITYNKISTNKYLQQIRYFDEFNIPTNQIRNLCDLDDLYRSIFGAEVEDCSVSQQEAFKLLIDKINNTNISVDFIKDSYLNIFSYLTGFFVKSSLQSIFLTNEDNINLINSIDFSGLYDLPNTLKQIEEDFNNNPCILKSDYDPNAGLHPFKLLLLRPAVMLLLRLHILEFKLKNLFNSSVFLHSEFISPDNTLIDYLYQSFASKVKLDDAERGQSFYLNFVEACINLLNEDLENNLCLVDPITKNRLKFSKTKYNNELNEEVENYIKYLLNTEILYTTNIFDVFFGQSYIEDEIRYFLSKKYDCYSFLFSNIDQYTNDEVRDENSELFLILEKVSNGLNIKLSTKISTISEIVFLTPSTDNEKEIFISNFNLILDQFKTDNYTKLFLNYIFNVQKILNISSIYQYHIISNENEQINNMFLGTFNELKNIIKTNLVNRSYNQFDSELECPIDLDFELNGLDVKSQFNLDIAKLVATTPIKIFKGLVETTDPNIAAATKIRKIAESAGAQKLPIIPYSLGLLPAGLFPPPVGIGPPILPPYGYMYWAIDAGEVLYAYSNDKNVNNRNKLTTKQLEDNQGLSSLSDLLPEECK